MGIATCIGAGGERNKGIQKHRLYSWIYSHAMFKKQEPEEKRGNGIIPALPK